MRNTLYPLVWVSGVIVVQHLPDLPSGAWRLAIAVVLLVCLIILALGFGLGLGFVRGLSVFRPMLLALALLLLAILWASWRADVRMAQALHPDEDNKVTRVTVLLTALPEQVDGGVRFIVQIDANPGRWPERVLVDWPGACTGACVNALEPGQRWRMALRFRSPHGRMNTHGFDTAGWLFEKACLPRPLFAASPSA